MACTYDENREYCKEIAETLEDYYYGNMWRCNDCGEIFRAEEEPEICPGCETETDFENLSLWDWFSETDFYDEEYHISRDGDLRGVTLMVACGGPDIYINTKTMRVELYWWTDRADYPIDRRVCEEIDAIVGEYAHFKNEF